MRQQVWDAGAATIDEIERIVQEEEIECEFARVPAYLHAPWALLRKRGFISQERSRPRGEAWV